MSQREKLIIKILSGMGDNNFAFDEICNLLISFDFLLNVKGSHHIFCRNDIDEIFNIQPKNGKAKAYQIKQIRTIIVKYRLGGELDV